MNDKEKQAAEALLDSMIKNPTNAMVDANAYRCLIEGVEHRVNAEKAGRVTDPK
jgi:hypothetical protein